MQVRALKTCFHHGRRRQGAVFEYELAKGAKLPAWLEKAPDDAPEGQPAPKRAPKEKPVAMSELGKRGKKPVDDPKVLSEAAVSEPDGGTEAEFLK